MGVVKKTPEGLVWNVEITLCQIQKRCLVFGHSSFLWIKRKVDLHKTKRKEKPKILVLSANLKSEFFFYSWALNNQHVNFSFKQVRPERVYWIWNSVYTRGWVWRQLLYQPLELTDLIIHREISGEMRKSFWILNSLTRRQKKMYLTTLSAFLLDSDKNSYA